MSNLQSPFKFLDSYQKEDIDVFFGRDEETKALYKALRGVKQLLVYGPSGSGKTSIIECGLRNQFSDADWFALTIRRSKNINTSVFASINQALKKKILPDVHTLMPETGAIDFGEAIEALFEERYQPVYLLFDQFEELLISGDEAEKIEFFSRLNQLVCYKVPCRVLLIMREEFIGHLSEFEPICPGIFQNRYRLEKMKRKQVHDVIHSLLTAEAYKNSFRVQESLLLADKILSRLPDERREIELTHIQVFLTELWVRAEGETLNEDLPLFHPDLVQDSDNLSTVLNNFLKNQLKDLDIIYGEKITIELLAAMISERYTKLQCSEDALVKNFEEKNIEFTHTLPILLKELEQRRIIRSLRSGEETRFEISHDVLAWAVGQNRTEEMKMRDEAADIYKLYSERSSHLSKVDMDIIRPMIQFLPLPEKLSILIEKSERHFEDEAKEELTKTKKRVRILRIFLSITLFALIAAGYMGYRAYIQNENVVAALAEFKKEQYEKQRLQFKEIQGRLNRIIQAGCCPDTLLPEMYKIAMSHPDSLMMQQTIVEIKNKSKNCK